MAINDKLNRIKEIKEDIKQALIDKGVEVTDEDSFASYADKITNIPQEGGGDPYYEDLYNLRTSNGTNMVGLFARTTGDSLDLTKMDVSQCTDMRYMFDYCTVKDIDCSGWDVSNVTDMGYMFEECKSNVNTTGWDTNKLTSANRMFYQFKGSIDISNWDMSNVTLITNGFDYANLTNINGISELKLPKVTSFDSLFSNSECDTLDLSSWNTDNITSMYNTFYNTRIRKIDLSNWNTSKVTNMGYMFNAYGSYLEELIIPDWDMTNVTSKSSFFPSSSYAKNLKYIDLSRSNEYTINLFATTYLPKRTESTYGNVAIPADSSQEVIDALLAKYWKPIGLSFNVESFQITSELDKVRPGQKTKIVCHSQVPWYSSLNNVEFISSDESIATVSENGEVTAVSLGSVEIYARLKDNPEIVSNTINISITEVDSTPYVIKFKSIYGPDRDYSRISYNNTEKTLKKMDYDPYTKVFTLDAGEPITRISFSGGKDIHSSGITELLKFDFNGNNITDVNEMFDNCYFLTSIDVSNWDVSNVTSLSNTFSYCESLASIDVSNWDVSNVSTMFKVFSHCPLLETVAIENWNIANVSSLSFALQECSSLKSLDLSGWDVSNVYQSISMFENCTSLEYLNLSTWDTTSLQTHTNMFLGVPSTCQIYVGPKWTLTESDCSFTGTFIRTNKLTINYQDSYEPYNNPYVEFSTTVANENSKRCYLTEETEFGHRGHIYLPNNETYWIHCSNNNETHGTLSSSITLESEKEIWIVRGESWYFEEEPNTGVGGDYISGFDVDPIIDSFVFDSVDNSSLNLNIYPYEQGKQVSFSVFLEDSTLANSDTLWPSIDTYEYENGMNNAIYCSVNLQISDDLGTATLVIRESNSGIEKRISVSVAEPQPKITDFTISPESLTFSDDGNTTATVTVIPAETDRAMRFSYGIGAQSQFNIALDESEAPNKYYLNIEATQLYKEEYELMLTITEERSGISKSIPVTIDSENIWVNPQANVKVYYNRADGNYDNIGISYGDGGSGFWNSDDNGQYASIWLQKGESYTITVFSNEDGSTLASGEFTFTEDTNLWLVEGESTFRTEKPE